MNKLRPNLFNLHLQKPPPSFAAAPTQCIHSTKSFNAALNRHSTLGAHRQVLLTYASMLNSNTPSDAFTYPSLLKACTFLNLFSLGRTLHQQLIVQGLTFDPYTCCSLINFYSKFGYTCDAQRVFDMMPNRDVVPWTSIIACYARAGNINSVVSMYNAMQLEGVKPSPVTVLTMLSVVVDRIHMESLHACLIKYGFQCNLTLMNCMLNVYGKYGSKEDASQFFRSMDEKDIVSWNSLVSGYSSKGSVGEILSLFGTMKIEGVQPNEQTFGPLVSAIAKEGKLELGRVVHGQLLMAGFNLNEHLETSLMTMYLRSGNMYDAFRIFEKTEKKDAVLWTAMITGLVRNECADKALDIFRKMLDSGTKPSATTMATTLRACSQLNSLKLGTSIHGYILRQKMAADNLMRNSLITMYAKCGRLDQSYAIFHRMEERDLVSWNALVAGYAENGHLSQALCTFQEMRRALQVPDSLTVVSLLQACASLGAYHQGTWIHNYVIRSCLGPDLMIDTALVDMYSKCGDLHTSKKCFDRMPEHDLVSWSTMIAGYGSHGMGEVALQMYYEFLQNGLVPNHVILLSVLYACSHNGLTEEGMSIFESMTKDFGIEPEIEHCACIVDLLCRAGRVEKAYELYKNMFTEPMVDALGIILDACRSNGKLELGKIVAEEISSLRPADAAKYIQLVHSYASSSEWDAVGDAWYQIRSLGLKKLPGWSFIELHGTITTFFNYHGSHPDYEDILLVLENLKEEVRHKFSMSDECLLLD